MIERKNRLAEALDLRGLKQAELIEKTGLKKTSVNGWYKNNWQPKQTALYKMAKVLDVSELWLAGYEVPMERPTHDTDQLQRINTYLSGLTSDQLDIVENLLKQLGG